jgi:hypothetical protein
VVGEATTPGGIHMVTGDDIQGFHGKYRPFKVDGFMIPYSGGFVNGFRRERGI